MFNALRNRIADTIAPRRPVYTREIMRSGTIVEKYDQNWFLRFLNIARQEDIELGEAVTDPMRQHAWVNIAVSTIARNIARAEFQLLSGDDVIETGPIYKLFTDVSPLMSRYQLWEATVAWKKIRGEAFWIFESGYQGGLPTEIYLVDPDFMRHTIDPRTRRISMWHFEKDHQSIPFLPDELIHFQEWNKWDDYRGYNPLIALSNEIVTDRQSGISNYRMIANGSRPQGILSTDQSITEEEAKELRDRWEANHRGASRAHRISVLGAGTTWQQTQLSPRDMEYLSSKKWNRAAILAKYGVPPAVVGVKDDMTPLSGSDTSEQMKAFWTVTLIPEIQALEDKMRTEFFGRYKLAYDCRFSLDNIDELQEDEAKKAEQLRSNVTTGLMTINEAREKLGLDPKPWGDTWWKPMALTDVVGETNGKAQEIAPEKTLFAVTYDIFPKALPKPKLYTPEYRTKFWQIIIKAWESQEKKYEKDLREWFFEIRSRTLQIIAGWHKGVKVDPTIGPGEGEFWQTLREMQDELFEEKYFAGKATELASISERHFIMQMEITGMQLMQLFKDLGIEVAADFNIYNTGALNYLKNRVTKVKGAVTETVRDHLRGIIKDGIEGGWSEAQMADGVRSVFNKAGNRAATIARTELGGVINDSEFASFQAMGFEWKEWLSSRDAKVRPEHMIDGERRKLDEFFSNGLLYPNDPNGDPGNVINCFLPETEVQGSMIAGLKARYAGPAIEIVTRGGNRLSVTPNHPILRADGKWCSAGSLAEGDALIAYGSNVNFRASLRPMDDEQKAPTMIEEVIEALRMRSSCMIREANLDGDGRCVNGDVEIVGAEWALLVNPETMPSQKISDSIFISPLNTLSAHGSPAEHDMRIMAASSGRPGSGTLTKHAPSIVSHCRPFEQFGFRSPANRNVMSFQHCSKKSSGNLLATCKSLKTDTGFISGDASCDSFMRHTGAQFITIGPAAQIKARASETAKKDRGWDAGLLYELRKSTSSLITQDEIVQIRYFTFDGHVYDLQSTTGWIIAHNIICGNCRCALLPVQGEE